MRLISISLLLLILPSFALAQSGDARLVGQVVCGVERWSAADRRLVPYGDTPDREEAGRCIRGGGPVLLAVMDAQGRTNFYLLSDGALKLRGADWTPYIGDTVEVIGAVGRGSGAANLRVDALRVLVHATADLDPRWEVVPDDPELSLKDLSGVRRRLSAYQGRVVVLNFFATYCVPCRRELPGLVAFQGEYSARGVQVVGVSAGGAGDEPKVKRFVKEAGLNFPVWLGATENDMARFGLGRALPDTVIIGRDGRVAGSVEGTLDPRELRRRVDALLAKSGENP
jgi:peroxiredoxin